MGFGDLFKNATNKATDLVKDEFDKQLKIRHFQAEQANMQKVTVQIHSGFQLVHAPSTSTMFQRQDGTVYFGNNYKDKFLFIDYNWGGPRFETITSSTTNTSSQEVTKGKSGKMAAGAIIGSAVLPGIGTAVGAAIGAGGKKKKHTNSQSSTNSVQQQNEVLTPATLKFKNIDTNDIFSIVIGCNTLIDSQIKGFRLSKEQSVHDISKDTTDALKGIKALKELLDMGAITQEEFEQKKQNLLNLQ